MRMKFNQYVNELGDSCLSGVSTYANDLDMDSDGIAAVRSAEKARTSTCALADTVANAVIAQYRQLTPGDARDDQEVVAGIVAVSDNSVRVISMGVGNKFSPSGEKCGNAVRDCHAEVLARRAFKLWLLEEYHSVVMQGLKSEFFACVVGGRQLVKRPTIQFLLYVSSCPCGNACVRRWGDSPKETYDESLGQFELPTQLVHPVFHAHARGEGQIAVSPKGQSTISSCSDKILRWNLLGLQGLKLSGIVDSRVLLAGIVIGRKFVRKHAERAFCCRLTVKGVPIQVKERVHHPILMCTAVKLDNSVFDTSAEVGNGAVFNSVAMWWITGMDSMHQLDGETGTAPDHTNNGDTCRLSKTLIDQRIHALGVPAPTIESTLFRGMVDEEIRRLQCN